jgi:hypothetical protein
MTLFRNEKLNLRQILTVFVLRNLIN